MKSKRILTLCFILLISFCLVGCGEAKTSSAVGNNLNKSVDKLSSVINSLEEINYNEIIISDLNPLADNTFNTVSTKNTTSKTKWYTVGALSGIDKTKNGAKYVNSSEVNGNKIGLYNDNTSHNSQKYCEGENCYTPKNTSSAYTPKYINNVSKSFVRTSLDNYIGNIEVLYNKCADCISCEAECKNAKQKLTQCIQECKVLCHKLKDGTITLVQNEIDECNSKISQINNCGNRLEATKGNIKNKSNGVSKVKNGYSTNISTVKEAYNKLFEALEARLDSYNQCSDAVCSINTIINKTKVNTNASEKNKSNKEDIRTNTQENNTITETENTNNNSSNNLGKLNKINNNSNKLNKNRSNNFNKNYLNNNIVESNLPPVQQPVYEQPIQNNVVPQQPANTNQNGVANQNPVVQQNPNKQYYGNGYNNLNNYNSTTYPYPPRNIDTYQNINKNIDTYRPNNTPAVPYKGNYIQQNQNVTNTQNKLGSELNINQNKTINHITKDIRDEDLIKTNIDTNISAKNEISNVQNINDGNIIDNSSSTKPLSNNETPVTNKVDDNAPIPYPYDKNKIAEQAKKQIDSNQLESATNKNVTESIDKEFLLDDLKQTEQKKDIMTLEETTNNLVANEQSETKGNQTHNDVLNQTNSNNTNTLEKNNDKINSKKIKVKNLYKQNNNQSVLNNDEKNVSKDIPNKQLNKTTTHVENKKVLY